MAEIAEALKLRRATSLSSGPRIARDTAKHASRRPALNGSPAAEKLRRNRYADFLIGYQPGALTSLPLVSPLARSLAARPAETLQPEVLLNAVASDPFLAARICGAANSIFFNHQHRPVQSVREALERVGMEFVQKILMEAPTSTVLAGAPEVAEYWSHCVTVSVVAQRLVEEHQALGLEPETAALLGLIHDIGRLVELDYSALRLREVARALRTREIDPGDNGHAKVAASLARSWSLPPLFQDVLRAHHQPSLCSGHWSRVCASVVFLADLVALGLRLDTATASSALSYLGLSSKQCQPLYDCSVQVEQGLWHAAQSPDLQRHYLPDL